MPYNENSFKSFNPSGEIIVALGVAFVLIILFIVIGILARIALKKNDFKTSHKGLLFIAEWAVEKLDGFVNEVMGEGFANFGGILLAVIPFLFLSFTIGITGLPTPMNNIAVPLVVSLLTFVLIHATSIRYTKWKYFKRYIDPIPIFLPVNLISMWSPLLSMTLRLFGNAVVGWILLAVINNALEGVSASLFAFMPNGANSLFFVPLATPLLHAYFDLFSGFIQTIVFVFLTSLFIAQEKPEVETPDVSLASRKEVNV